MENNQPILSAKKLCKYFDTVKAVDGMDLSFYQGRVHTIIGENGSGNAEKLSGVGPINGFVRSMGCEQTAN